MKSEQSLEIIADTLRLLVSYDKHESALVSLVLLHVARYPGCTAQEMADKFGVTRSTISRTATMLRKGKQPRQKRRCRKQRFIRCMRPYGREHRYELTERGAAFIERVVKRFMRKIARTQHAGNR